jgi:MATE family multidrug resistance protein
VCACAPRTQQRHTADWLLRRARAAAASHRAGTRLWQLAWPLSWMEVLAFAKELIITAYVGHLGAAELSALVLAQTVYNVTGNAP